MFVFEKQSLLILLTAVCAACACSADHKGGDAILLRKGWTLTQEATGRHYKADVPSTVAGVLMDEGVLPADLLESDNYSHLDSSLFSGAWTFTTTFKANRDLDYTLRFDGLNYYADIWLNGTRIAAKDTTYGVFCVREYDISKLVRRRNTLKIRLEQARPGDLNIGFVDWNPGPPDASMGIVRDVTLKCYDKIEMKDVYVHSIVDPSDLSRAELEIRATLINHSGRPFEGVVTGTVSNPDHAEDSFSFSHTQDLLPGEKREIRLTAAEINELSINKPRIWWSRDLGSPELYALDLEIKNGNNTCDRARTTFGIRSIKSGLDENGHRAYWLNGRKLLVLGAGWTDDIFLRDTYKTLEAQVRMVADMNLNCIRFENIWGKDSSIYDLCDRYGLLAMVGWSCFWEWENYCHIPHHPRYGCIMSPELNVLALKYFESQVKWLRNHPSVFVWLTGSDRIPNPELEEEYLKLYEELDDRPYVCAASGLASLAGPSGNKMVGPYEYVGPEYWYDPLRRIGSAYGFNTETSIGLNMPQEESVRRMISPEDLWPVGPSWDAHCTVAGEGMNSIGEIRKVVSAQFGEPQDLSEFVRRANAVDYDGTRAMFEAFRVNRDHATGLIQWMLNSAWPSLYWQLYDYYGVPTAGYYGVKKGCEPVQLIYNYDNHVLYAVNGSREPRSVRAEVKIYGDDSSLLGTRSFRSEIPDGGTLEALDLNEFSGKDIFVFTGIEGGADNFYAIPSKGNVHDWTRSTWFQTPISSYSDMSFVSRLPEPELVVEVTPSKEGYSIEIANEGNSVAYQIVLKLIGEDGQLVVPAFWSDNFFSMAPHTRKTLTVSYDGAPASVKWTVGLSS